MALSPKNLVPKGLTWGNVAIGAGVVFLTPIVLPIVGDVVKSVSKATIKGALLTYEGARVTWAEAKESISDITAEAKAEVADRATATKE